MKKTLLAAIVIPFLVPSQVLAAGVRLSVDPQNSTLQPFTSAAIDVVAAYDGTDRLLGGAFSLTFDASLLEVLNVTLRAPVDIAGTSGSIQIDGTRGTIAGVGFSSFVGIGGTFDFATITFRSKGLAGTSPLSVFDANDLIYSWASESLEPVTVNAGFDSITVVPEPASIALLLAGLGIVAAVQRTRPG